MEAKTLQAFLRVLYTVNNNPQYILAKSSSQIQVITCSEMKGPAATEPTYARAPLKACLAAVCDSSPELLQDPARDFSLYFLDPLEAQPLPTGLAPTPHSTGSPRGVAVALGLISWALESNDSINVFVTGTIVPNTPPALEVICALRETKRMPKPVLHSYPSLGSTSALGPSYPPNHLYSSQNAWMNWLPSHLQHDPPRPRTLTRSADFPELYIGPPRRARGRPEGTASSRSRRLAASGVSSVPVDGSSKVAKTTPKTEAERKAKQATKSRPSRAQPINSPFICAPLTRNTSVSVPSDGSTGLSVCNPQLSGHGQIRPRTEPCPQARAHPDLAPNLLLGLLSSISSPENTPGNTTSEQQAALLSALQGVLAANPHLLQLAATSTGVSATPAEKTAGEAHGDSHIGDEHDDGDSDIIVLDSSTIDTTIFRKSSVRPRPMSDYDTSSLASNQELLMPRGQSTDSSPLPASTPSSGLEGASTSSQTSTPTMAPESVTEAETPTSKRVSLAWVGKGEGNASRVSEKLATPSPSRSRKRKLEEYIQGQVRSASPTPPHSPSPSVARTCSAGRASTTGHWGQSSPTGGSTSSMRLPSMLGSMRGGATSGSTPSHGRPATNNKNGNHSSVLFPRPVPPEPKAEHAGTTDPQLDGATSDTFSLKRRRTLTEFAAEYEARKSVKVRSRFSSKRKLGINMAVDSPQATPSRYANFGPTPRLAQSSPPHPRFRTDPVVSAFTSISQSGLILPNPASSPLAAFAPMSSSASTSTAPQTKNLLKSYVVPAWARTSTAMLPRLSDEALARQNAEREAKKAQASLRRREAARAKRKRVRRADQPSRESSVEDEDETATNDARQRTLHHLSMSRVTQSTPVPPPPLPSLPVFASDAVEPIPSSPPRLAAPVVPSTPPRKPVSTHRTPSKPSSCSLFTPSCQESVSLFTPSTPSITRPPTRATFTPRSPTVIRRSGGTKMSPRKSVLHTPKRNGGDRPTPKSSYADRNLVSPSVAPRTPRTRTQAQMQPGTSSVGKRTFLLPPPSPCAGLRTPQRLKQAPSNSNDSRTPQSSPASDTDMRQHVKRDKAEDRSEEEMLARELDNALLGATRPNPHGEQRHVTTANDVMGTRPAEEDGSYPRYALSPLPPSSPPPTSLCSSPARNPGSRGMDNPREAALPLTRDADTDALWLLSDDSAAWFTDVDASVSAWLTETEAWLTDVDTSEGGGGAPLTDSDGVSNWFSDVDLDVGMGPDVDRHEGGHKARDEDGSGFDVAAPEYARAALVERNGQRVDASEGEGDSALENLADRHAGVAEAEFWASIRSLLGGGEEGKGALDDDPSSTPEVALDVQALLDSLAS